MIKIFHHGVDFDGWCSGAILKRAFPDAQTIGMNYNKTLYVDKLRPSDTVFLVDYCPQPFSIMRELHESCNVIWIDHHASAIREYEKALSEGMAPISGIRDVNFAACELTWKYIHENAKMPDFVYFLGRYDVWKHGDHPYIKPFQSGMFSTWTKDEKFPSSSKWTTWFDLWDRAATGDLEAQMTLDHTVEETLEAGKLILDYEKEENERTCKMTAFPVMWEGVRFLAANTQGHSPTFDCMKDPEKYDAFLLFFGSASGKWTVSMYTERQGLDLSIIASKYGGGGHMGAAGFSCVDLPFNLGARPSP